MVLWKSPRVVEPTTISLCREPYARPAEALGEASALAGSSSGTSTRPTFDPPRRSDFPSIDSTGQTNATLYYSSGRHHHYTTDQPTDRLRMAAKGFRLLDCITVPNLEYLA